MPKTETDAMSIVSLPDRSATTCVIADDHPPIIDALTRYLAAAGFSVLAAALDGEQALEAVKTHRPRVCVADVRMPRLNGLELARQIAQVAPDVAVLLYSGVADRGLVSD